MTTAPTVRRARPDDAAAIARVNVAAWRDSYAHVLPTAYLLGLSEKAGANKWRIRLSYYAHQSATFVAELPRRGIVGYGSCGAHRSPLPHGMDGEVFELYVDPSAQGHQVGRRLLAAMADHMVKRSMHSACVWVLRDNPARWFYQHLGGRLSAEATIRFAGTPLAQVAYCWPDLASLDRLARSLDDRA
jgi:ribosomal protein S18 acetylase RimI-like enzyme